MSLWHHMTGFAFFKGSSAVPVPEYLLAFSDVDNPDWTYFQTWVRHAVPTPRVGDTILAPIPAETGSVRKRYVVREVIWDYGEHPQGYPGCATRLFIKVQETP